MSSQMPCPTCILTTPKTWFNHQVNMSIETAKEFAFRMAKHFVLKGPQEWKEGGNSNKKSPETTMLLKVDDRIKMTTHMEELHTGTWMPQMETTNNVPKEFPTLLKSLTQSEGGIDLIKEICGKYELDTFFKKIPKNFVTYKRRWFHLSERRQKTTSMYP